MRANKIYSQIIGNYFKNREFRISLLLMVLSLLFTFLVGPIKMNQIGLVAGHWATDLLLIFLISVIPFVVGFMWPIKLGLIIKSQFANPRSTLFPSFRIPHIQIAFLFYSIYLLLMLLCRENVLAFFDTTLVASQYFIIVGFFSILLIWFAYIAQHMLWQWLWLPYFIWFFGGEPLKKIDPQILLSLAWILFPILTLVLGWRLTRLKDGMYEYSYVSSLKQKDILKDYYKRGYWGSGFYEKVESLLGIKRRDVKIGHYPKTGNILARANHWKHYIFGTSNYLFLVAAMFAAVMIFIDLKYQTKTRHTSSMSFFIIWFPSMMVWPQLMAWGKGNNFKSILGFDLLKPLKRENFIVEVGLATLIRTIEFWFALFLGIEIIRLIVVAPNYLFEPQVWLTGIFSLFVQFLFFGVFACLSKFTSNQVITYLMSFLTFILVMFMAIIFSDELNMMEIMVYSVASLIGGFLLSRIGYRTWYLADLN